MRNAFAILIGLLAPIMLPGVAAVMVVFVVAVVLPPMGLIAGILSDALYHTAGQIVPYGTLIGGLLTLVGYVVRRFLKTRIMGA